MKSIIDGLPVANLQDAINCGDHPHYLSNIDTSKYQRPDGFPIGCKSADGKVKKFFCDFLHHF